MTNASADELLRLVQELGGRGGAVGTKRLAKAAYEANRSGERPASRYFDMPPWYGIEHDVRALEAKGYVEVDPGMASPVPHGAPARTAEEYFVVLTDKGSAAIAASAPIAFDE